ncbi:MAG: alpha/beta fold hydrolase [Polymorphobacter sp.]|uniref:alpha/beta fold hydrolase n=1 Tax=Polymorphobacter sp. TaxID=1909290 RepID=UPI003A8BE56D
MQKAYVDTRAGQVHVRCWGDPAAPLIVLLHWTPLSGRMFAPLAAHLAGRFHVLAPDLPGYGRSDARGAPWTMADWADAVADVMPRPGLVLGGHLSAAVAATLAARRAELVRGAILDGVPFLTPELRAALAAMPARPAADGDVHTLVHDRAAALLREYGLAVTPERLWPVMIDYLETDFVSSAPVLAGFDGAAALAAIGCPLLLLGARGDSLAASLETARALRPEARWHVFDGPCPVHLDEGVADYAAQIIAFAGEIG